MGCTVYLPTYTLYIALKGPWPSRIRLIGRNPRHNVNKLSAFIRLLAIYKWIHPVINWAVVWSTAFLGILSASINHTLLFCFCTTKDDQTKVGMNTLKL
jgi:hypothetical protein